MPKLLIQNCHIPISVLAGWFNLLLASPPLLLELLLGTTAILEAVLKNFFYSSAKKSLHQVPQSQKLLP
jgi:hypothetical protein